MNNILYSINSLVFPVWWNLSQYCIVWSYETCV